MNLLKQKRDQEGGFKSWYAKLAEAQGLDPNPSHPLHFYDYKSAWKAGATPDEAGHLPSKFKHDWHPNRFVPESPKGEALPAGKYWDTKTSSKIVGELDKSKFDKFREDLIFRMQQEERRKGTGF